MSEPVNSVTMKVLEPLWNESSPRMNNNCLAYSNYSYSGIGPRESTLKTNGPVFLVGKSKPVNGEVASDSHGPKSKLSQENAVESTRNKKESNESKPEEKVEECREEKDKPFDINQFFMTDTSFLPFTGGVSIVVRDVLAN